MRYRPLGLTGRTVSALTLTVGDGPNARGLVERVYAALEAGINSFELRGADPEAARALGQGLSAVDREMVVVSLRLRDEGGLDRDAVFHAVESTLLAGRLGRLDILVLDAGANLDPEALEAAAAAKAAGRLASTALAGEAFDKLRGRAEVDALACPYNLCAGWPERNRIRAAADRGKFVIGWDSYPDLVSAAGETTVQKVKGLFGLGRRAQPLEKTGGYEFMRRTSGWAPDEICLGYALTEPALATVVVEAETADDVQRLAEVAERELPTGLPAQIEMARFAAAG